MLNRHKINNPKTKIKITTITYPPTKIINPIQQKKINVITKSNKSVKTNKSIVNYAD